MLQSRRPVDYTQAFWIEGPVGNNALSFALRGTAPRLRVPSLMRGRLADVRPGHEVVFEDVDEHGHLRSCTGLAHLVAAEWGGIPTVVVDNHNHAFYFWFEAHARGLLLPGATLIHLDQHRDTRTPTFPLAGGATLEEAFAYTNFHLNVGNYIVPARQAGLLGELQLVTGGESLGDFELARRTNKILNIDLDFFAPEMSYIHFDRVRRFVDAHLPTTSLITVATSPFFVDQARAITFLRKLAAG